MAATRYFVIVDIDASGSVFIDSGFTGSPQEWLDQFKGDPGAPGPVSGVLFGVVPPVPTDGQEGNQWFDTVANTWWAKENGTWVKKAVFSAEIVPTTPPQGGSGGGVAVESPDDTFITQPGQKIVNSLLQEFSIRSDFVAGTNNYRIDFNRAPMEADVGGVALLYHRPLGDTRREVYYVTQTGGWFMFTGLSNNYNANGWTSINGDPRIAVSGGERDPRKPVAVLSSGNKVYRFGAEHAFPDSPFDLPWVLPSFDNLDSDGHDYCKIGEVLTQLGKTAADIIITSPGTPQARLNISGAPFQIDFTAVASVGGGISAPTLVFNDTINSTTDNISSLSKTVTPPSGKSNRLLVARPMVTDTAANAADPGSLTYGGQAMTRVTEGDFNDNPGSGGYHFRTGLYILKAYPEGAQSFVWTPDYSSSKASLGVACHLFFFDNVDQITPVETGNIGKQSAISPNIAPVITTVDSNSLVLLDVFRSSAYFSGSFPVTPGTGVTTVHDENLGSGAGDAGQLATYSGIKSAPTPGVNTPTATIHDPTGILCLAVEIKGHAAGATFTIGVHDVVNVGAGGPDISTDLAPIDWPVAEGTGLGGAGGGVPPPNNPTPAPVFATILQSHGLGLAENRDFSTGELAGFASHASCFRTFGHMRNVAGAPAFAGDTANTTLIAQLLATGAAVIHCPIAAGPQSYNTQFPDVTDLVSVNAIGDYLASIAAAALARGWATDKYVLELFDEPLSTQGMAATKQIYQIWVNKIRAANPDIWIAAVGNGREGNNGWEPDYESWAKTIPLNDPRSGEHRIAYGHHFFNTMNFTNQGTVSQWPAGVTYLQSGVNLTTMRAEMQRFRTWANIHGVQIYISSCGVDKLAPSLLDRQNWTTDFFTVCQELAIPAILRNDDSPGPGGAQGVFQLMSLAGAVMTLDPSWATIIGNFGTGVPIVTPIAAAMVGRGGAILEGIGRNFTHTELDNFSVIGHLRCDDDNEVTTAPAWDGTGVCAQQMLYLIGKGVPVQLCGPYMHYQNKGSGYAPYMSQMLTRSTAMANWVKNNNIPPNAFIWNPANEPTDRQVDWRTTLFPQLLAAWRAVLGPAYVVTEPISNGAVGNEGNWNWFDPLVNGSYVANADVNVIPSCHDYFDTVQATYNGQTTGTLQLPAGCTQANFTNLIYGPIGTWSRAHNRIVLVNEVGCVRIAPGRATYLGNKVAAAKASGVSITFFGMDFVGGQFALDTGNPRNIDPAIASIFV